MKTEKKYIIFWNHTVVKIKIWRNNKKLLAEFNVYVLSRLSEHDNDKHGGLNVLNFICKMYLTIWRGTPTMVQLLIMYYIILVALDNKIAVAVIAFGLNSAAYVAEIVRSGIMSVDEGQFEAGRSLG